MWKGEGYEVTTLRGEGEYSDGRRPDSVEFAMEMQQRERDMRQRSKSLIAEQDDTLRKRTEEDKDLQEFVDDGQEDILAGVNPNGLAGRDTGEEEQAFFSREKIPEIK